MSRTNDQIVGPYTAMSSALVLSPVRSQPSWESKVCVATKNSLMDAHPTNNMRMCRSLLRHCWPLTVLWRMIGSTMPTLVRWWRRVLFLPVLYPHPSLHAAPMQQSRRHRNFNTATSASDLFAQPAAAAAAVAESTPGATRSAVQAHTRQPRHPRSAAAPSTALPATRRQRQQRLAPEANRGHYTRSTATSRARQAMRKQSNSRHTASAATPSGVSVASTALLHTPSPPVLPNAAEAWAMAADSTTRPVVHRRPATRPPQPSSSSSSSPHRVDAQSFTTPFSTVETEAPSSADAARLLFGDGEEEEQGSGSDGDTVTGSVHDDCDHTAAAAAAEEMSVPMTSASRFPFGQRPFQWPQKVASPEDTTQTATAKMPVQVRGSHMPVWAAVTDSLYSTHTDLLQRQGGWHLRMDSPRRCRHAC